MNASDLNKLSEDNGLDILESTIKINESGVDFRAAHAEDASGDKWILRVPRRTESMRNAAREKAALGIIRKQATFEVPHWSISSENLIAYKQLKGVPAATVDVEQQKYIWSFDENNVPDEYYDSLGSILAELHSFNQQEFKRLGIETLEADELRTSMKSRMHRVKEQYDINEKLWARWQAWLEEDSYWPDFTGVRHGDMHPGHIIIDRKSRVTGMIDWSEVSIGDVSVDFIAHLMVFGQEGLKRLIDAYSNAGGRAWARMDEHVTELLSTNAITIAEYAKASGLKEMEEAAAHILANDI